MNKWLNFLWPILLLLSLYFLRDFIQSPAGSRGHTLYQLHCQNCHMEEGQGLGGLIPPLAQSDYLSSHFEQIPCIMRYGQKGEIEVNGILYDHPMPGNESLSDEDLFQLMRFIYSTWGEEDKAFTRDQISEYVEGCINP